MNLLLYVEYDCLSLKHFHFSEEFKNVNLQGEEKKMAQLEILPRFYTGLPAETDELKQKLREEARAQFLQVCECIFDTDLQLK